MDFVHEVMHDTSDLIGIGESTSHFADFACFASQL